MTNYPLYAVGTNAPGYLPDTDPFVLHYDHTDASTLDAIVSAVFDAIRAVYEGSVEALSADRDERTPGSDDVYVYPLSDDELSDAITGDEGMSELAARHALDGVEDSVRRAVETGAGFDYACSTADDTSGAYRTTIVFVGRVEDDDATCSEFDSGMCEFDCSTEPAPGSLVHANGVVEVIDAATYARRGADVATCGACGRSWDDAVSTGVTPTPAARCPFEYDHEGAPLPSVSDMAPSALDMYDGAADYVVHRVYVPGDVDDDEQDSGHAARVYRVTRHVDECSESPRSWDNVGRLSVWDRRYVDVDEADDVTAIDTRPGVHTGASTGATYSDLWHELLTRYDMPVVVEVMRLVANGRGDVFGTVSRDPRDGSLSVDWPRGAYTFPRNGRAPYTYEGARVTGTATVDHEYYVTHESVFDAIHDSNIDGFVVVPADVVSDEFDTAVQRAHDATSTPADRARATVEAEFEVYNSWAAGDVYGYRVGVAVVTLDDVEEFAADEDTTAHDAYLDDDALVRYCELHGVEFDDVDSCSGYYGYGSDSGIDEAARDAVTSDMQRRADLTVS